jgi:DNA polymerase I
MSVFRRIAARFIPPTATAAAPGGLRLAFDIETDGLLDTATKIHCICTGDLDNNNRIDEFGPTQIASGLEHLARADYLIGHNICNYDLALLRKLRGWAPKAGCRIVDTLIAARLALPHLSDLDDQAAAMGDPKLGKLRGHYSIEAWGARLGMPKVGADIEDWSVWTPEMQARCVGDVAICKTVWQFLRPDAYSQSALELEHRVAPICSEITAAGIPFDSDAATRRAQQWTARRAELAAQLLQQFPGTNLNSRAQIGRLLESRGWVPQKRTEKTKQPKIDNELLEIIPAIYPEFTGLAEHYTLGCRLGQLTDGDKAWLKHIGNDGRIHGALVHIGTPHSRAAHFDPNIAQIPNPKRGKPLATECRALFRHPGDWVFVACDQAGLQDRCFSHYLAAFDGGAYARDYLAGIDPHWRSVTALGLVSAGAERDKTSELHAVLREGGKSFRYGFLFGMRAKRAGEIITTVIRAARQIDPSYRGPSTNGAQALRQFEAASPGLKQLRESLERQASQAQWVPGLDGRRVPTGAQYKALNRIVTSAEAIVCKRWLVRVHDELRARFHCGWDGDVVITAWIHDELVCCCRPELAKEIGDLMVRHAKEPGEFYGLKVPLDADYQIGRTWAGDPIEDATVPDAPSIMPEPAEAPIVTPADLEELDADEENSAELGDHDESDEAPDADVVVETPIPGLEDAIKATRAFIAAAASGRREETSTEPPRGDSHSGNSGAANFSFGTGNDRDRFQGDYHNAGAEKHADSADKPYGPIRARLLARGYQITRTFPFMVPGEAAPQFYEDRYELKPGITPTEERPRKTSRYWHQENGKNINGTGPRRVIFNWPAIVQADPKITVFITEGANKSEPAQSSRLACHRCALSPMGIGVHRCADRAAPDLSRRSRSPRQKWSHQS